jgi:hypothetical protein
MSPPVHGCAAAVCAKVAYDVPVLAVVVWLDERRCRTMSIRPDARCSVDTRSRRPCTVAPPSCAPWLPTMYQCSLLLFGGTRADVGQCRLVEARDSVSTIDLAARARWCRLRKRQRCLRCTSTRGCCLVGLAQMLDKVDPLRRARGVDHRSRRPCTVAPQLCAPTLPTMYQYLLLSFGGTSADVRQCRLVLARSAVSIISLAAGVRRCHGTIEMHDYTYGCIK